MQGKDYDGKDEVGWDVKLVNEGGCGDVGIGLINYLGLIIVRK